MHKKDSQNGDKKVVDEELEKKEKIISGEEFEKLQSELKGTKELLLRTAAEYDNFRKRSEREKDAVYSNAKSATIAVILPLADSLEAALNSSASQSEEYKKGIELLQNQLQSCFSKLDVESFGEVGDDFDPNIHNAISHIEKEGEKENFISTVFQKGYKMGDKIIRHATVQVTN